MRKITLLLVAAMVSVPAYTSLMQTSEATTPGRGALVKLNGEGKRACEGFDASGTKAWTANVKGQLEDDSGGLLDSFQVKTCFATQAKCETFIKRIRHHVNNIEYVRFAKCSVRNG